VSKVTFDLSRSTGAGLRYDFDFGDGVSASGQPVAWHTFDVSDQARDVPTFTVRGTVTDASGRTDTASQTISVMPVTWSCSTGGWEVRNWYTSTFAPYHWLRFTSQVGLNVSGFIVGGTCYEPQCTQTGSRGQDTQIRFTGTLDPDGGVQLALSDTCYGACNNSQSPLASGDQRTMSGFVTLLSYPNRYLMQGHTQLIAHGGSIDGATLDYSCYIE
jgi:hypothetical protein